MVSVQALEINAWNAKEFLRRIGISERKQNRRRMDFDFERGRFVDFGNRCFYRLYISGRLENEYGAKVLDGHQATYLGAEIKRRLTNSLNTEIFPTGSKLLMVRLYVLVNKRGEIHDISILQGRSNKWKIHRRNLNNLNYAQSWGH